jgi:MoaA/NifB/PqqE/SkfB family radical SAM enzyme
MMRNGELTDMMNGAIGRLVKNATRIALSDFSAIPALMNILKRQGAAADLRKKHESEGLHVPPFMIASIVRACNLRCAGCYDRAKQDDESKISCGPATARELDGASWARVFGEARDLGVSFILLAGGEPLLKREVIRSCSDFPEIIFPVFTNGLLIDESWTEFFSLARNVIPVLSLEGDESHTDKRRGTGVFASVSDRLALLKKRKVFYGASITLTSENYENVLSESYVGGLVAGGARVVFFVEYVPFDPETESLVVTESQKAGLPARLERLREKYAAIFLDFPGDEGAFGGCLASGRGFVHVNAAGSVESCPFAPYADSSVAERPLADALASPLLARIRGLQEGLGHTGGCALFENREKVEALL